MFYGLFLCCQKVGVPVAFQPKFYVERSPAAYFARRRSLNRTVALKFLNDASGSLRSVIPIRKGQSWKRNKERESVERFSCVFCPEIRAFKNFILIQEKYSKDTGQVDATEPGYLLSFFFFSHKEFNLIYGGGVWRFVTCNFLMWVLSLRIWELDLLIHGPFVRGRVLVLTVVSNV